MVSRYAAVGSILVSCIARVVLAQTAPITPPAPRAGAQAAPRAATVSYTPTPEQLQAINAKLDELFAAIKALKDAKADDTLIVDAESCAWVVHNIVTVPGGFIDESYVNRCTTLVNDGLRRAAEIKAGTAAWQKMTGRVNRAYRSAVDGTAQPYHLMIPASYDPSKPTPLYVYLHGRSQYDPDLGMGWAGGNDRPGAAGGGGNYIRVEAFGRANNSYRWLGEADVLECIAAVQKRYNIDPNRILLAGFSLGGAGAWQTGLHNPDMFCGLEIDAGVIGNRTSMEGMNPADKAAQTPYGIMIGHAVNVFDVPLVAYAGANDAQLASSTAIRKQLTGEGYHVEQTSQYVGKGTDINALFLATPGQGHSHATGETLRLINEFNDANFKRGRVVPDHIRFVTYTTRYNHDFWITIDGMRQQFNEARVDAQRDAGKGTFTIKTSNVSRLLVTDAKTAHSVAIDGDTVEVTPNADGSVLLANNAGHWQVSQPVAEGTLVKRHDLQGPINDAFLDAFLCVSPTGQPYNAIADERGKQELDRFAKLVERDYLGLARTKADTAITDADIADNNLILFGDPGSNAILAKIADKLPIKWTRESIIVGDKTYSAADHVPVLIYPNPLNPHRYVVLNTGLPAGGPGGGAAYGDYAILKLTKAASGQIAAVTENGGVFDEQWQLPAK